MKALIVFLLIFSLQFPAWAVECPIPAFPDFAADAYSSGCSDTEIIGDNGCSDYSSQLIGTWAECKNDQFRVYALYKRWLTDSPSLGKSGFIASSLFIDYSYFSPPGTHLSLFPLTSSTYTSAFNSIGTIINQSDFCWCPPPVCVFPQCIGEQISQKFPFDIFLNIPAATVDCPSLIFFGQVYDLCWLYELLRWFKYPIAISLLIKLAMHL
jgi:hypothetical protein